MRQGGKTSTDKERRVRAFARGRLNKGSGSTLKKVEHRRSRAWEGLGRRESLTIPEKKSAGGRKREEIRENPIEK